MRRNGEVTAAGGLLPFCHLGWGYRGVEEFDTCAAPYLADGQSKGQWVEYVGEGSRDELEVRLKALPGGAEALADGTAAATPVEEFYAFAAPGIVDPVAAVERRAKATKDAVDRGFSGIRVIVDATSVARTEEQRRAFARFEHLLDKQMATEPVSALCAYDLDQLDPAAAAELICLHPFTRAGASGFRLFATDEGGLALAGELDLGTRALFERTLERLEATLDDGELLLDLDGVGYLEHNVLVALEGLAVRRRTTVRLTSQDPSLAHMVDLLGLDHVTVDRGRPEDPA